MVGFQKYWLHYVAFVATSNVRGCTTQHFAILLHAEAEVDFGHLLARFSVTFFPGAFFQLVTATSGNCYWLATS